MLILTSEDRVILGSLAKECSREGEEAVTTQILIDGFSLYGEEPLLRLREKRHGCSRGRFFREKYGSLLENIGFAGKTFKEVFSDSGRVWLCQMVRGEGVPVSDVEDVVQDLLRKFWRARWVERYNPLISSWRNFFLVPVQKYLKTYWLRKSRKVTTGAFSLDRDDDDYAGRSAASRLYDVNDNGFPGSDLIRQEVMEEWEKYLRSQKPIRTVVRRDFEKLCTLLPPGVQDIPTEEERDVFFLQGGHYNSRVTTRELYANGISPVVPNGLLVDYITTDPVDNVPYVDEITGEFITQKDFPNPNFDISMVTSERRTWADFYDLVTQGLQIEEIARELKMASPSVPARIQRLESLFRAFWLISTKVPRESKILAAETYCCPGCHHLDRVQREECRRCGADMRAEAAKVRFDAYPWPKVRVTRATYERLGNRRQALMVQTCSLSIRF